MLYCLYRKRSPRRLPGEATSSTPQLYLSAAMSAATAVITAPTPVSNWGRFGRSLPAFGLLVVARSIRGVRCFFI